MSGNRRECESAIVAAQAQCHAFLELINAVPPERFSRQIGQRYATLARLCFRSLEP